MAYTEVRISNEVINEGEKTRIGRKTNNFIMRSLYYDSALGRHIRKVDSVLGRQRALPSNLPIAEIRSIKESPAASGVAPRQNDTEDNLLRS